jgi:hypothetical protein
MAGSANVLEPRAPGPGERIQDLDVLRGFALFGIVFINIYQTLGMRDLPTGLALFVQARFYVIFSLLFGIGSRSSGSGRQPAVTVRGCPWSGGSPTREDGRREDLMGWLDDRLARLGVRGPAGRPDLTRSPTVRYPRGWIVLGGELAVPCTRNPL